VTTDDHPSFSNGSVFDSSWENEAAGFYNNSVPISSGAGNSPHRSTYAENEDDLSYVYQAPESFEDQAKTYFQEEMPNINAWDQDRAASNLDLTFTEDQPARPSRIENYQNSLSKPKDWRSSLSRWEKEAADELNLDFGAYFQEDNKYSNSNDYLDSIIGGALTPLIFPHPDALMENNVGENPRLNPVPIYQLPKATPPSYVGIMNHLVMPIREAQTGFMEGFERPFETLLGETPSAFLDSNNVAENIGFYAGEVLGTAAAVMASDVLAVGAAADAVAYEAYQLLGKFGIQKFLTLTEKTATLVAIRERVLSNITETRAASITSNFKILTARTNQIFSGYNPDKWIMVELKQGDIVYGGLPGQSSYYTDFDTIFASEGQEAVLNQNLQVKPHPIYGYRKNIGQYEVSQDMRVLFGITSANSKLGGGMANQFFLNNYSSLRLINEFNLKEFYEQQLLSTYKIGR
jgi:hypothetical protein